MPTFSNQGGYVTARGLSQSKKNIPLLLTNCIQKWEFLIQQAEQAIMVKGDGGANSCNLCVVFNTEEGCDGCPVKDKTGMDFCHDSPFDSYISIIHDWINGQDFELVKRLAQEESDFLRELLAEYQQTGDIQLRGGD